MSTKPQTEKKPPQRQKSTSPAKPKKKGEPSPTEAARSDVPDEGEQPVRSDTGHAKSDTAHVKSDTAHAKSRS